MAEAVKSVGAPAGAISRPQTHPIGSAPEVVHGAEPVAKQAKVDVLNPGPSPAAGSVV